MIGRRNAIGAAVLSLAAPTIWTQSVSRPYRVGVLGSSGASAHMVGPKPRSPTGRALLRGMGDLGYTYGENFVTEPRGAEGRPERYPALIAELVQSQVAVIVASGPTLGALNQSASTIPVVMAAAGDPVSEGLVQSLAHPGGRFTGLSSQGPDLTGKRLELLRQLAQGAGPLAVFWDRTVQSQWQAAETAARQQRWELLRYEIHDVGDIETAFKAATQARAGAVLVFASGTLFGHAAKVTQLAAIHRIPAMYSHRSYVDAGGLVSYSADLNGTWYRAAFFVDKILKGARPADMPVEQPTKFELVVNLKAAAALGLRVPRSLLLRADELIQ